MPGGRPSDYSEALGLLICGRIGEGESLRSVTRDPAMPGMTTVWQWLKRYPEFAEHYARAKEARAEAFAEEIVEIADSATDSDSAQVAKIRVDARKWVAARILPKQYGDRVHNEISGTVSLERIVAGA